MDGDLTPLNTALIWTHLSVGWAHVSSTYFIFIFSTASLPNLQSSSRSPILQAPMPLARAGRGSSSLGPRRPSGSAAVELELARWRNSWGSPGWGRSSSSLASDGHGARQRWSLSPLASAGLGARQRWISSSLTGSACGPRQDGQTSRSRARAGQGLGGSGAQASSRTLASPSLSSI